MKPINHESIPSFYHIDEYGNIFNVKRNTYRKPHLDKDGYANIVLYDKSGNRRNFKVHQLVARTYIGNPPSDMNLINHKDGIRDNNHVSNLEWSNDTLNKFHSKTEGAFFNKKKDVYRLVERLCSMLEVGYKTQHIMIELGIKGAKKNPEYVKVVKMINQIRSRKSYRHISDKYKINERSTTSERKVYLNIELTD